MNIFQNCLIDLLEENGLTVFFLDNYIPGVNTYYFDGAGSATLVLTESCLSEKSVLQHLKDFGIAHPAEKLSRIDKSCECDFTLQ